MVEYPDSGAVVLQSYLDPRESGGGGDHSSESDSFSKYKYKDEHEHDHIGDDDSSSTRTPDTARPPIDDTVAPALISVVVAATSDDARGQARCCEAGAHRPRVSEGVDSTGVGAGHRREEQQQQPRVTFMT